MATALHPLRPDRGVTCGGNPHAAGQASALPPGLLYIIPLNPWDQFQIYGWA